MTRIFFVFFSRGILLYDFIDDDYDVLDDVIVDDASEEKVVISEQLWEWFGLFCFV